MPKVLISDNLSPRAKEIFEERGIEVDVKTGMSKEELTACIGDYDGLAIRSATKVTEKILAAATNLKVVGRAGIGVDNVDVNEATARGVVVMNTPFGNAITTAEHAIALMLTLARQIAAADQSTRSGKWEKSKFMGVEITGKTLGVIGCGNIGSIVVERAIGLKMRVIAFDPFLTDTRAAELGVERVTLDNLFKRSDFITLHTPLTDQTRGIIDAAAIDKMRPGVRLINCARGGLIVEDAALAGLESGKIAGLALDVFEQEPPGDNPLLQAENIICTPHLGASTTEAQVNVAIQVAEQLSDYLTTGAVVNALNMPAVSADEAPRLKPYMELAEQLGSFAGQLTKTAPSKIVIEYEGEAGGINTKPISAAILTGLLKPLLDSVNMVSAPAEAHRRGIEVSEIKHDRPCDFQNMIRLSLTTESQTRSVAGTVFGGNRPRLISVKDIPLEAELAAHMLYVSNDDKPGLIGRLGTVLADAGINIATFHLGRKEAGGDAIALVEIDQEVPPEILRQVADLPNVTQANKLSF